MIYPVIAQLRIVLFIKNSLKFSSSLILSLRPQMENRHVVTPDVRYL